MPFFFGFLNGVTTNKGRYWVGGTGTWDTTTTTHWAYYSGGPGGAPVPTVNDNVYFNASSGGGTVTRTGTTSCKDLLTTGFTGTIASNGGLTLGGSLNIDSLTTWSYTGTITATATGNNTITTNGKTLGGSITFNNAAGTWSYIGNTTSTANCTITAGTLNIKNINYTGALVIKAAAGNLDITNSNLSITSWSATTGAGTLTTTGSSIVSTGNFVGGGYTYNAVQLIPTSTLSITGANTFNGAFIGANSNGYASIIIGSNQIFNSTCSLTGLNNNSTRLFITTSTAGLTPITLICNGGAPTLTNIDFQGITASGSTPWTGTSLGDNGGNTNITFTSPVTRYLIAGALIRSFAGNFWATSSGGSVGASMPLGQDTIIMDSNSFLTSGGLEIGGFRVLSLDFTNVTNNPTLGVNSNGTIYYGDLIMKSGMTMTGNQPAALQGYGVTQTINMAGITYTGAINCNIRNNGTLIFASAFDMGNRTLTMNFGNLNQGTSQISCGNLIWTGTTSRTWTKNSDVILNGTSQVLNVPSTSSITVTDTSGTIKFTNTTTTSKSVTFGGKTYNNVWFATGGASSVVNMTEGSSITNNFNDMKFDPLVTLTSNAISLTNRFNTFTANGTLGNLITLNGVANSLVSTSGTVVNCSFMSITNSAASGAVFTATSSTNGGGNTGWIITP